MNLKSIKNKHSLIKISLYLLVTIVVVSFITTQSSATDKFVLERNLLPLPAMLEVIADTPVSAENNSWQQHIVKIKKNDTLSQALERIGLSAATTRKIINTENSGYLTNLRAGDKLQVWIDDKNNLQRIVNPKSNIEYFELTKVADYFKIMAVKKNVEITIATASGVIGNSFYVSAIQAGLSPKTVIGLSDIFAWEIDFIRQLRTDDPFKVIYERMYVDGKYIGDGDILAAKITTEQNNQHLAFLLRDEDSKNVGYFNENAKSLRKAFLRNPIDYVRITSGFSPSRFHPILKKWRAHRGVDYAAPTGTPIRAAGDGEIIRRWYDKRGFGKVIFIQHANNIQTVYGHMSRFGPYKIGQRVRQGTIIGYVGSTGLSTGPHLHYEFRIDGVHVDPLSIDFPNDGPVPKKYKEAFVVKASLLQSHMERMSASIQFALKGSE